MSAKRIGVEILIVLALVGVVMGVWWWKDRELADRVAREQSLCQVQVADLRQLSERRAGEAAAGEATAVFRAFAAGVQPAMLAGRRESLDQAVTALLELPGVDSVHLLAPDGTVLASSDRKLLSMGRVDERGGWVLATTELTTRAGDRPGVTEVAAPVVGASGPAGYLWMGYRTAQVRDAARPDAPKGDASREATRDGSI